MKRMRRTDKSECPYCFSKAVERIDAEQYQSTPPGWLFRCLDSNCGRAFVREVRHGNQPRCAPPDPRCAARLLS
jgi:hypothetical protein